MKTQEAINHAGSAKALADMLGITPSAISQWGPDVPEGRCWQLKVLKPDWFEEPSDRRAKAKHGKAASDKTRTRPSDKPRRSVPHEHPQGL